MAYDLSGQWSLFFHVDNGQTLYIRTPGPGIPFQSGSMISQTELKCGYQTSQVFHAVAIQLPVHNHLHLFLKLLFQIVVLQHCWLWDHFLELVKSNVVDLWPCKLHFFFRKVSKWLWHIRQLWYQLSEVIAEVWLWPSLYCLPPWPGRITCLPLLYMAIVIDTLLL